MCCLKVLICTLCIDTPILVDIMDLLSLWECHKEILKYEINRVYVY